MVLNDMADAAAATATDKRGIDRSSVTADLAARAEQESICRRLAAIEAEVWTTQGILAPSRYSMAEAYEETTRNKLQLEAHIAAQQARALSKAERHRLVRTGAWDKCSRCARHAKHGNRKYWRTHECSGYQPQHAQRGVYANLGEQQENLRRKQRY